MLKIVCGLMADGILNGAGNEKWHTSNLNQILPNEKYIGDALLQKTFTKGFLTKQRVKNNGYVPQCYIEDNHDAIIPREVFMQVQEEMIRRRCVHTGQSGKKRSFSSNHCFSQIIICGNCGEIFKRVHWNNRGKRSIVWRCASRLENTGVFCDARTVLETTIEQVLVTAINTTLKSRDSFLATLQNNIAIVLSQENDAAIEDIEKRLNDLQIQLLKLASAHTDIKQVTDEIYSLRDEKQKAQVDNVGRDDLRKRNAEMSIFLRKQPTVIKEYDEKLVRRLIDKVTVHEDRSEVVFSSGVAVEVEG